MRGPFFESYVIAELLKALYNHGLRSNLYFWRDQAGHEVDLIIDKGEHLIPIEIKSGMTFSPDWIKALIKLKNIAGSTLIQPSLVYGGDESYSQSDISVLGWRDPAITALAV